MEPLPASELARFIAPYPITVDQVEWIRGFQNQIYRVTLGKERAILRIAINRCHSLAEMEAELRWIEDLAARGLKVCR